MINLPASTTNYTKGRKQLIEYLVFHYVGAEGGAVNNGKYFQGLNRGASAHYFVGHENEGCEIVQSVADGDTAWHCGAATYKHAKCRNANSIGIEMCCRKNANGTWYIEPGTLAAAVELGRELMAKHNIPISKVLRHYDVTGKVCPEPFVRDERAWDEVKKRLQEVEKVEEAVTLDNTPDSYAADAIAWAINNGILLGDGSGNFKLHDTVTRQDMLVFLYRAVGR